MVIGESMKSKASNRLYYVRDNVFNYVIDCFVYTKYSDSLHKYIDKMTRESVWRGMGNVEYIGILWK